MEVNPTLHGTRPAVAEIVSARIETLDIEEVVTASRSPWLNPFVERVIGSIRRECLDHVIVLNESHLRRILASYIDYYHCSRTHLFFGQGLFLWTRTVPTGGQSKKSMLERSPPFRRSAAYIIATSGAPPERLPFCLPGCTALHRLLADFLCADPSPIPTNDRHMAAGALTIKLTLDARGPYTISIHGAFWPEPRSDEVFGNDRK